MTTPALIRPYQPADLPELYRICLLTAAHGEDATSQYADPMLPGHVYAGPYGRFQPGFAFIADDGGPGHNGAAGYILGARDTAAFAAQLERQWWPALRERYPDPAGPQRTWTADQRTASFIHHPPVTPASVLERYPSHLHIDLLPRLQSAGYGRALMDALTTALRAGGSPGVHLNVHVANVRAQGFYRHLGFTDLPPAGDDIFTLGLDLT